VLSQLLSKNHISLAFFYIKFSMCPLCCWTTHRIKPRATPLTNNAINHSAALCPTQWQWLSLAGWLS